MSLLDMVVKQVKPYTQAEIERLSSKSDKTCPICDLPMTIGEEESAGICIECYMSDEDK